MMTSHVRSAKVAWLTILLVGWAAQAQERQVLVERGRYLVEGIAACGLCHFAPATPGGPATARTLSGGRVIETPLYTARMSNITPDVETGIGSWTEPQIARAIREGTRPDGSIIGPPMPIHFYRGISDEDVAAMAAYLKSQPPVRNPVARSDYKVPLTSYGPPLTAPVPTPSRTDLIKYGEYLAGPLGHCTLCHTAREPNGRPDPAKWGAGGVEYRGPWGVAVSRNLTPHETGLRDWSDAEIERAIREGLRKDGTQLKPPMPYSAYKLIDDHDMKALIAYLRSLPARPIGGAATAARP
jgi:mono/diheme cytochrome c family protein